MEVILLERVERLGQMGDVVRVKNGFARNYLLRQKKALRHPQPQQKVCDRNDIRRRLEPNRRRVSRTSPCPTL